MDNEQINKLIDEVSESIEKEEYTNARKILDDALEEQPENIQLLLQRAKLFRQLQNYGKAFNDLQAIVKLDPSHKEAKNLLNFTREILQCQQLDIYASTNLNNDPWID
jgi:tetratricopeptide (TPR) repeat protein